MGGALPYSGITRLTVSGRDVTNVTTTEERCLSQTFPGIPDAQDLEPSHSALDSLLEWCACRDSQPVRHRHPSSPTADSSARSSVMAFHAPVSHSGATWDDGACNPRGPKMLESRAGVQEDEMLPMLLCCPPRDFPSTGSRWEVFHCIMASLESSLSLR